MCKAGHIKFVCEKGNPPIEEHVFFVILVALRTLLSEILAKWTVTFASRICQLGSFARRSVWSRRNWFPIRIFRNSVRDQAGESAKRKVEEEGRRGRKKGEESVNGERCIEFLLLQGNDDYGVNNGRKNTMRKNSSESARSGRLIESAQLNKVVP